MVENPTIDTNICFLAQVIKKLQLNTGFWPLGRHLEFCGFPQEDSSGTFSMLLGTLSGICNAKISLLFSTFRFDGILA